MVNTMYVYSKPEYVYVVYQNNQVIGIFDTIENARIAQTQVANHLATEQDMFNDWKTETSVAMCRFNQIEEPVKFSN